MAAVSDKLQLELELLKVQGERDRLEHKLDHLRLELRELMADAGRRKFVADCPGGRRAG
jgi:hypothetical protein